MNDLALHDEQTAYWSDESHRFEYEQLDIVAASGCWITDRKQRRLLDAASGHSCVNLGYAHEELIEAAQQSLRTLAYCSPEHRCRPVVELAARLDGLLGGGYHVRYAATGGGANELAIEIARRYWRHDGRCGAWFGFQHASQVRPDIVTMAKGITSAYFPLSAVAVSNHIFETFLVPGNAMHKLITMAGHPVGCDVALKVVEIMERDGLVDRVRRNAEWHLSRLATLARLPGVRDVRGVGQMWGLEFAGVNRATARRWRTRSPAAASMPVFSSFRPTT